ncbi:hypothetical protein IEQ34_018338 [Dendrobium chrysotoxum]|uniref:Uncharacterized protein n=1 Tax=Dendrobium chrysotoxum TaxID=161865 RepID=A0AAV7GDP1_DENCH|nr:hypothetical protein IEQ34_018338 [Dendrobium chrysotoxum]
MAVAEPLSNANKSRDLVRVILVNSAQGVACPGGATSIERLLKYLTDPLQRLLPGVPAAGFSSFGRIFGFFGVCVACSVYRVAGGEELFSC